MSTKNRNTSLLKPVGKFLFSVLIVGGCWACSGAFSNTETITGFVQSGGTDDNDEPIDIFIFDGTTEYHVTESIAEKELRELVDRKIKATGPVSDGREGTKTISVKDYKVVD